MYTGSESGGYNVRMKLIVGLGNPGTKYEHNRHNVGFVVVECLSTKLETRNSKQIRNSKFEINRRMEAEMMVGDKWVLVKPQTYMNDSGRAVAKLVNFYKIPLTDVYIVHDDLDITLGNYKIQHGKGPQIHNGLLSIEQSLGTDQFWNVRVGVENREVRGNKGVPGVVYSLQDFTLPERKIVEEVVGSVVDDLLTRVG